MARRSLKDKNIRKLSRVGNHSLGLTIPIEIVKKFFFFIYFYRYLYSLKKSSVIFSTPYYSY